MKVKSLILILIFLAAACNGKMAVRQDKKTELLLEYGFRCGYKAEIEGKKKEVCIITKQDQEELETHLILFCR